MANKILPPLIGSYIQLQKYIDVAEDGTYQAHVIYPTTVAKGILLNNGKTLDTYLSEIQGNLEEKPKVLWDTHEYITDNPDISLGIKLRHTPRQDTPIHSSLVVINGVSMDAHIDYNDIVTNQLYSLGIVRMTFSSLPENSSISIRYLREKYKENIETPAIVESDMFVSKLSDLGVVSCSSFQGEGTYSNTQWRMILIKDEQISIHPITTEDTSLDCGKYVRLWDKNNANTLYLLCRHVNSNEVTSDWSSIPTIRRVL